jgi:hypothetical protein
VAINVNKFRACSTIFVAALRTASLRHQTICRFFSFSGRKLHKKHLFMQFLATFDQIAAYTLLCMASKMDRMQLFIIFQGNNCTKTPIYAIVGLFLSKQLHMGSCTSSKMDHVPAAKLKSYF